MAIRFETTKYEASHGRKPRGRGSWWFEFTNGNESVATERTPVGHHSYTEAKAWASKRAREVGAGTVVVMP